MRAVNADGARRLLTAAAGVAVVWVGSASVYDPRADRSRVTEDHPVGGRLNAYGRTKAAGEALAPAAGAVVLRPRAVCGHGDPHLPRLLSRVRAGVLLLPGPDVRLSLTAVGNLSAACLATPAWAPGAYNIADARAYPRDETLRRVLAAHGVAVRVRHVPLPAARAARVLGGLLPGCRPVLTPYAVDQLSADVVLDTARARAAGWRPALGLAEYLARAARHTPTRAVRQR